MKRIQFQGEPTDVSTRKEALLMVFIVCCAEEPLASFVSTPPTDMMTPPMDMESPPDVGESPVPEVDGETPPPEEPAQPEEPAMPILDLPPSPPLMPSPPPVAILVPDLQTLLKSTSHAQCFFFPNQLIYFLDTLIQYIYIYIFFLIIKINNFRRDLCDISAKTATLVT